MEKELRGGERAVWRWRSNKMEEAVRKGKKTRVQGRKNSRPQWRRNMEKEQRGGERTVWIWGK